MGAFMISSKFTGAVLAGGILALVSNNAQAHVSAHDKQVYDLGSYEDFIMNMRLPGSATGCCGGEDAIPAVHATLNKDGGYRVTVPAGTFGLPKDVIFDVPQDHILTGDQAYKICKAHPELKTCTPPEFTILWISSTSLNSKDPTAYCFWYPPQSTYNNKTKPDVQYGAVEKPMKMEDAIVLINHSRATYTKPAIGKETYQPAFWQ